MPKRLLLTPGDFDVKILSPEEKKTRRTAVLKKIEGMIAWGSADSKDEGKTEINPKKFFQKAKVLLEGAEKQRDLNQNDTEQQDWNLVLTGDAGTGTTCITCFRLIWLVLL
jgi:hypothetical protein